MPDAQYIDPVSSATYPLETPIWRSPEGRPLMLTSLPGLQRQEIDRRMRSLWRYRAAMPLQVEDPITLGEGCTPLIDHDYRGHRCKFKLEWFSPTGSFKDRGASVLLSCLKQQGITSIVEDSSGNGGAAIAAYGAAGGLDVKVFVPDSTSIDKIAQTRAYGADIVSVAGLRDAAEAAAITAASTKTNNVFYAGHNWHPFFLQGTKTIAYEIWEDLGFQIPDNIVIPASAGSILLGCNIAFEELRSVGETDRLPRLFVSQPANCAPLHASFQSGHDHFVDEDFKPTIAEGTAIKRPLRLKEMIAALQRSGGSTVAIKEDDIIAASMELAASGLFVEPSSAHAAAAFFALLSCKQIDPGENTVVILTGSGLKTTSFYSDQS